MIPPSAGQAPAHLKTTKTVRCVVCKKQDAVVWCGHVLHDQAKIAAGWCYECSSPAVGGMDTKLWKDGYVGAYEPAMGVTAFM